MEALELLQRDELLARTVAQFAAACSAIRDEDCSQMNAEMGEILKGVLGDAAQAFSFRKREEAGC
jgi:hypothetical protein